MRQLLTGGTASVIVDGQAGSCGKGKIAAYLALREKPTIVVANFGPNAGHTVYLNDGTKLIFRHLPAACVSSGSVIVIGAGAVIDVAILQAEIAQAENSGISVSDRLFIHPRAAIISKEDQAAEADGWGIASTGKGVGMSQARKLMRRDPSVLACNDSFCSQYTGMLERTPDYLVSMLQARATMLIETSQGFDLCINHGVAYPFCTARQISTAQALADSGLPPTCLGRVFGVVRPWPIRVGNTAVGESGPYASDSIELSWDHVAEYAGMNEAQKAEMLAQEITTVTGRQRRVFSFSHQRLSLFSRMVGPTDLCLTFADQIDVNVRGVSNVGQFSSGVMDAVLKIEDTARVPVRFIGTGPLTNDLVELSAVEVP